MNVNMILGVETNFRFFAGANLSLSRLRLREGLNKSR